MMKELTAKLFIFAGEPSGDLHGANLIKAIKDTAPNITIEGVAGKRMRAEGVSGPLNMEDFEVMGLSDVLASLPRLIKQFYIVRNAILKKAPDAVILIDYADFNLRLAKHLRKRGFKGKIVQYISPSVWAWGKHRIKSMADTLDLLLTIYPFESSYFAGSSLEVQYVGSPIKEQVSLYSHQPTWLSSLGVSNKTPIVGIFPGSRKHEIIRNLPTILQAAEELYKKHPEALFGISCSNSLSESALREVMQTYPNLKNCVFPVPQQYTYELMRDSRCAIAKSGTVTLELAMHHCPTVAVYKTSRLNRLYAKYIMKAILPNYCIVNILAGKEIYPELIKEVMTPEKLIQMIKPFYTDSQQRQECIQECMKLSHSLGSNRTGNKAAESVIRILSDD